MRRRKNSGGVEFLSLEYYSKPGVNVDGYDKGVYSTKQINTFTSTSAEIDIFTAHADAAVYCNDRRDEGRVTTGVKLI